MGKRKSLHGSVPAVTNTNAARKRHSRNALHSNCLHQQFWCWGQDVIYPQGNLLLSHGCRRIERPAEKSCASLYVAKPRRGVNIVLRGFGVFISDSRLGGLFLHRDDDRPWLIESTSRSNPVSLSNPVWELKDLPMLHDPRTPREQCTSQSLQTMLYQWIADYERWVIATCGLDYRLAVVDAWRRTAKSRQVPYETMISKWRKLAKKTAATTHYDNRDSI